MDHLPESRDEVLYSFHCIPTFPRLTQLQHTVGVFCSCLIVMSYNAANNLSSIGTPKAGPRRIFSSYQPSSLTPSGICQVCVLITLNAGEGLYVGLRPRSSIQVWIHKLAMVFTSSPAVSDAVECVLRRNKISQWLFKKCRSWFRSLHELWRLFEVGTLLNSVCHTFRVWNLVIMAPTHRCLRCQRSCMLNT